MNRKLVSGILSLLLFSQPCVAMNNTFDPDPYLKLFLDPSTNFFIGNEEYLASIFLSQLEMILQGNGNIYDIWNKSWSHEFRASMRYNLYKLLKYLCLYESRKGQTSKNSDLNKRFNSYCTKVSDTIYEIITVCNEILNSSKLTNFELFEFSRELDSPYLSDFANNTFKDDYSKKIIEKIVYYTNEILKLNSREYKLQYRLIKENDENNEHNPNKFFLNYTFHRSRPEPPFVVTKTSL